MVYDVIVIGLGAVGMATTYQLAQRYVQVLGIDQFSPPHILGSSHGDTRITRQATGEGAKYAELSLRSRVLWSEIEEASGENLYASVGVLNIASGTTADTHGKNLFRNAIRIAEQFHIPCEILTTTDVRERFPQFAIQDTDIGYFEPGAGYLRPEACISAQLMLARRYGAEIHTNECVQSFRQEGDLVRVVTNEGSYAAKRVIVSAGAYLTELIGENYASLFSVTRQVLYWFDIGESSDSFEPSKMPVFICDPLGNKTGFYGFPAVDGPKGGIKVARQQREIPTTARSINREVSEEEMLAMYKNYVGQYLPGLRPVCLRATACLYTNTRDSNFIIDNLPGSMRIIVASPCSGHGFKHSAAIGEALAQLALGGRIGIDLREFGFGRFP